MIRRYGAMFLMLLTLLTLPGLPGAGCAEGRTVILPDGAHQIRLPADMEVLTPEKGVERLWAVYGMRDLELEIFTYTGNGLSPQENAERLTEAGSEAEIREIAGVSFLVYRDRDEADGALCIGYMYPVGDTFVELSFWYGSTEAGEQTKEIMETFGPVE